MSMIVALTALDDNTIKSNYSIFISTTGAAINLILILIFNYFYEYVAMWLTEQELKERQKAQLRQKALKKGLDPEALVGKYPPMIRMYSKYERRTDTRTYEDRKKLYEGGWEVLRSESLDAIWKEKYEEWSKRPSKKLPKWFDE